MAFLKISGIQSRFMITESVDLLENSQPSRILQNRRIMLFDLATGGHHAFYIYQIVRHWCEQRKPSQLIVLVSPDFLDKHADVVNIAKTYPDGTVTFIAIKAQDVQSLKQSTSAIAYCFKEWEIYRSYAKQLAVDHCLFMYIDHLQFSIAFGPKAVCPFSGIYFRPTFHYNQFASYAPSWRDRWRQWRQKLLLSYALRNSQFKSLLSLDPFAVKAIQPFRRHVHVLHLADPVELHVAKQQQVQQLKEQLEIQPDRKIFLLFGRLDKRKGIYQTLEAIRLLPLAFSQQVCLLLVGNVLESDMIPVQAQIADIKRFSQAQVILWQQYVPENEVSLYFQLADIVLVPYQQHVGMSGILLRSAAADKPVIATDYGLIGELVRCYRLGCAVRAEHPHEIAQAMLDYLSIDVDVIENNRSEKSLVNAFLEQNLAQRFTMTIAQQLDQLHA
jgi:glycosyltransferase involved in cell wall biosynthesis